MIKFTPILPLALLFLFTGFAFANKERPPALLQGIVIDAVTKKPISGVLVSAISPAQHLLQEAVTDVEGHFSFEQLPARPLELKFGKKGYLPVERLHFEIKEKKLIRINMEVVPEEQNEELEETENPLLKALKLE